MPRSTRNTTKRSNTARTTDTDPPKTKRAAAQGSRKGPSEDAIRQRAFEIYESREPGSASGTEQQVHDWLAAEAELSTKSRKR